MPRELIAELAQNPKIAISVSAATSTVGAGTKFFDLAAEFLPLLSVFVGILVSFVVIAVQVSDMMRKNREHKAAMIRAELEIEILRQKTKVLDDIDKMAGENDRIK